MRICGGVGKPVSRGFRCIDDKKRRQKMVPTPARLYSINPTGFSIQTITWFFDLPSIQNMQDHLIPVITAVIASKTSKCS